MNTLSFGVDYAVSTQRFSSGRSKAKVVHPAVAVHSGGWPSRRGGRLVGLVGEGWAWGLSSRGRGK